MCERLGARKTSEHDRLLRILVVYKFVSVLLAGTGDYFRFPGGYLPFVRMYWYSVSRSKNRICADLNDSATVFGTSPRNGKLLIESHKEARE